jgi:hypothetical protein
MMAVGWQGFPVAGMGAVVVAFVGAATVDAVDVAAAILAGGRGDASRTCVSAPWILFCLLRGGTTNKGWWIHS